jgi:hypothetical protein
MPHLVPRQDPARHQVACVKPQWGESWQSQPALSGMSSAPLRRLHVPHRSWMFVMVLLPPLLHGTTWSKWSSTVEPHRRHLPPSRAATAIFTS